jgi:hypothetical protein
MNRVNNFIRGISTTIFTATVAFAVLSLISGDVLRVIIYTLLSGLAFVLMKEAK